jgi:threonine/homoserine/homoserine lactone efflux protein
LLSIHALLIYCGIYAVAAATPGPGVVSIVARAIAQGFRATIPAAFGMAVGDWILMTLSAFGLAFVAREMGSLFLIVKLAGAAYLVYMGYKFWTAPVEDVVPEPNSTSRGFLAQLALTLGNPKAIGFMVALLPTVVDLNKLNTIGYLELSAVSFLLLPAVSLAYAAAAAQVRGLLASRAARRRINKGAAVVMVGAGVGVAVS